ncbi:MAG: pyruvate, phosphate dikinase, partial [Syntrophobacteraceae bacterium]|nr:pyruvate, phosphate dikinase [Syntrophobacteraceae bacterium]
DAGKMKVYRGEVESLSEKVRPGRRPIVESPLFLRMRRVLDHVSPLHLTNPEADDFKPEGCRSFHDIIRFTHETAMREMFSYSDIADRVTSFRLKAKIPLFLQVIDLGGGLRFGLSTCDTLTPECVESIPFKAIWKGFSHPGITWSGSVAFDAKSFLSLMASGAMAEAGGGTPGGTSYAMISQDYMNLSARFGYHFATVDALCGEDANQNYVTLQFSGGAGSFQGRSLRIGFLGNVLKRLGFEVSMKGDLIDALLSRYDRVSMEEKLDQMGRLLACTRLLDMAITGQNDVAYFTEAFFQGDYNFLERKREDAPRGVYIHTGDWSRVVEEDRVRCLQDGSKWGAHLSSGMAWAMGKVFGGSYQEFLDSVNAYFYFPLVVVKDWQMGDGIIRVRVKPVRGNIDRAGGIAFGLKDVCHYFSFRINALEDNVVLFEYEDCKRFQRQSASMKILPNEWHDLRVEIKGNTIQGYVNDQLVIDHEAQRIPGGHVGLWTKADSVTLFEDLQVETGEASRTVSF